MSFLSSIKYDEAKANYENKLLLYDSYSKQGLSRDAARLERQVLEARAKMDKELADYTINKLKK